MKNLLTATVKFFFGEKIRRARISASNRAYRQAHGDTRRVPVHEGGRIVDYIYLPVNREPLKQYREIQRQRRIDAKARRERGVVYYA